MTAPPGWSWMSWLGAGFAGRKEGRKEGRREGRREGCPAGSVPGRRLGCLSILSAFGVQILSPDERWSGTELTDLQLDHLNVDDLHQATFSSGHLNVDDRHHRWRPSPPPWPSPSPSPPPSPLTVSIKEKEKKVCYLGLGSSPVERWRSVTPGDVLAYGTPPT